MSVLTTTTIVRTQGIVVLLLYNLQYKRRHNYITDISQLYHTDGYHLKAINEKEGAVVLAF